MSHSIIYLFPLLLAAAGPALALGLTWPANAKQCEVVNVTWTEGVPPYTFWLFPLGGMPLTGVTNQTETETFASIQLPLSAGTNYVAAITDSSSDGQYAGFASAEITTVVASGDSSCLQEPQTAEYNFDVSGVAKQCEPGFVVTIHDTNNVGPFSFVPIPLDQSFEPFTMEMGNGTLIESDWLVSLPEGTRFTIVMGSKDGQGQGGVGDIYQVGSGNSSDCLFESSYPTGAWPKGIPTNQLSRTASATLTSITASNPITETSSARSKTAAAGSGGKSTPVGAIAGGVIGGVAGAAALVALGAFLLLRRRRQKKRAGSRQVDLYDDYNDKGGQRGPAVSQQSHPLTPFISSHPSSASHSVHGEEATSPADAASLSPLLWDDGNAERQGSEGWTTGVSPSVDGSRRDSSARLIPWPAPQPALNEIERELKSPRSLTPHYSSGGTSPASPHPASEVSFMHHEDGGRLQNGAMVELPPMYAAVPRYGTQGDAGVGGPEY
ncbi:hypothetical protein IAT38_007823 [Cryptococcus sp. DSM 104549]